MDCVVCRHFLFVMKMKEIKNIDTQKADNRPTKAEIRTNNPGKQSEVKIATYKPGWFR